MPPEQKKDANQKPAAASTSPRAPSNRVRLVDEDKKVERWIDTSDREFVDHYVDNNIDDAYCDPNPKTLEITTMVVSYRGGGKIEINLDDIPIWMKGAVQLDHVDWYVRRKGIIYPTLGGKVTYSFPRTPNIVKMRTLAAQVWEARKTLVLFCELGAVFGGAIASAAHMSSTIHQVRVSVNEQAEARHTLRRIYALDNRKNIQPPQPDLKIKTQITKVTRVDMLRWEKEGGHALRKHSQIQTKDKLLQRINGENGTIPPPQTRKGGYKPPDFRVWQGDKQDAASRFQSEAVMHEAVRDAIAPRLSEIQAKTAGGKPVKFSVRLNYRVGAGWLKTSNGVEWHDDLRGVTIRILPRVPTKDNPDSWYLLTAFPEHI